MESIKERGDFSEQAAVLVYQYRQGKQLKVPLKTPMKAQALERKTEYIQTQNGKTMRELTKAPARGMAHSIYLQGWNWPQVK